MTEQEFNEIKSLITGLGGITEFKSTADRVDKALNILDRNKQLLIHSVVSSLPSKDEKLIGNMCLSFRHDFRLLPKLIQDDLKRDCKNWLIAYENNRN